MIKPEIFIKKKNYSSEIISISGPSAVGKSTITIALSKALDKSSYDLDDLICNRVNLASTKEVISNLGHEEFKRIQNQELKNLFSLTNKNFVFACGGEIYRKGYDSKLIKENRKLIMNNSYNICLIPSNNIEEILRILYPRLNDGKRDTRTEGMEGFRKYVEPAIDQYIDLADLVVFVHNAGVEEIIDLIKNNL